MRFICISIDLGGSFIKAGFCSVESNNTLRSEYYLKSKYCFESEYNLKSSSGLCSIGKNKRIPKIRILKKIIIKTNKESPAAIINQLVEVITLLLLAEFAKPIESAGDIMICVGVPGIVDRRNFRVTAGNLNMKNYALVAMLRKMLRQKLRQKSRQKFSMVIENDAKLFALADAILGAGKNYRTVLGITLGTGLGSGIIIDKNIFLGKGNAGEIGHGTIDFIGAYSKNIKHIDESRRYTNREHIDKNITPNDTWHVDKKYVNRKGRYVAGEVEEFISDRGIVRTALENGLDCSSAEEVYELALKRNPAALKTFEQTGVYLGYALLNAANTIDPDIIVLGGGISNSWKLMKKSCTQILRNAAVGKIMVEKSKMHDAGIIGGCILALRLKRAKHT